MSKDSKRKLPDPKIWKWCQHPECQKEVRTQKEARKLAGFGGKNEQQLMRVYYYYCAVFLEDYCWKHLPDKAKLKYKGKIGNWVKQGRSLEGANLYRAELDGADLPKANLQKAYLKGANLQKVDLWMANLQKATLARANLQKANLKEAKLQKANLGGANLQKANLDGANLQEANLWMANLQEADLRIANLQKANLEGANLQEADLKRANLQKANLEGANLQEADLWMAKLQEADLRMANLQKANLEGANLQKADLSNAILQEAKLNRAIMTSVNLQSADLTGANFHDADLEGVSVKDVGLRDVLNLHFNQIKKAGEENSKSWEEARIAYKGLKEYFSREGLWKDAATAYYREKLMEFKHSWASGKILKGIWLLIFRGLAGFGEHPWKTVIGAIGTILFFSFVYWLGADFFLLNLPSWIPSGYAFLKYLYFSVVTFATLGFGDIFPQSPQAAVLVIVEVLLGYFFLGLIVTLIARKVGR